MITLLPRCWCPALKFPNFGPEFPLNPLSLGAGSMKIPIFPRTGTFTFPTGMQRPWSSAQQNPILIFFLFFRAKKLWFSAKIKELIIFNFIKVTKGTKTVPVWAGLTKLEIKPSFAALSQDLVLLQNPNQAGDAACPNSLLFLSFLLLELKYLQFPGESKREFSRREHRPAVQSIHQSINQSINHC